MWGAVEVGLARGIGVAESDGGCKHGLFTTFHKELDKLPGKKLAMNSSAAKIWAYDAFGKDAAHWRWKSET